MGSRGTKRPGEGKVVSLGMAEDGAGQGNVGWPGLNGFGCPGKLHHCFVFGTSSLDLWLKKKKKGIKVKQQIRCLSDTEVSSAGLFC